VGMTNACVCRIVRRSGRDNNDAMEDGRRSLYGACQNRRDFVFSLAGIPWRDGRNDCVSRWRALGFSRRVAVVRAARVARWRALAAAA